MDDDRQHEPSRADGAAADPGGMSWRSVWQVPTLLIAVGLIVLGLWTAVRRAAGPDFAGAFSDVDILISRGEFDEAARLLRDAIEPNLDEGTTVDRARFHALVGDWLYAAMSSRGPLEVAALQDIDEQYAASRAHGGNLTAPQVERWAMTLIELDRLSEARDAVIVLEGLAARSQNDGRIRESRNRLLRTIVERSLESVTAPDEIITMLDRYREDRLLSPADELWALARQAEVRLDAGAPQEALDHLLVDMRRVEQRIEPDGLIVFGEAYVLLARAYLELGRLGDGEFQLQRALDLLAEAAPARGDALVLLSQLVAARSEHEEALALVDQVVRDFRMTPSFASGLLARAELRSILGDHDGSLEDYELLPSVMPPAGPRRDTLSRRAGLSLADRHDAMLAMRRFELAIRYITAAELFFDAEALPPDILARVAATSRMVGDHLVSGDGATDPAAQHEAALNYRRAGDSYVRRARALEGSTVDGDAWAESLWLAADSYDLAGLPDRAAHLFQEFLAGRPSDDPRWSMVTFRLAQADQAQMRYEEAARSYETLIESRGRGTYATRSFVPLARVYIALDRRADAETLLVSALDGEIIGPEAVDYADALVELGRLLHDSGRFVGAIERLDEALARYPDDERAIEVTYRLADARRQLGLELKRTAESDPSLPPSEVDRLQREARSGLQSARDGFAEVCQHLDDGTAAPRTGREVELLRTAWRFRADCAFHLGAYAEAIDLYDLVARRYADHHASINALIQIHNCFIALGDFDRARAAHVRAQSRLDRLPDDAFDAPDALMDREAWELWLRNSPVGRTAGVTEGGA